MIRIYNINIIAFIALTAIYSCSNPKIPTDFDTSTKEVVIYPDYKDVVIPPNIAPLNFIIKENGIKTLTKKYYLPNKPIKTRKYRLKKANGKNS